MDLPWTHYGLTPMKTHSMWNRKCNKVYKKGE